MNEQIKTWLEIGNKNIWIKEHNTDPDCLTYRDPAFDEKSFCECETVQELIEKFEYGNWCIGQAFYYKNICFINQIDAGDEWLVIRDDIAFESFSCQNIIKAGEFEMCIDRILKATPEQLKNLDYI